MSIMIPFNLFIYICVRGFLYSLLYSFLFIVGIWVLLLILTIFGIAMVSSSRGKLSHFTNTIMSFNEESIIILVSILIVLFIIVIIFCINKLVLNKMIFKPYKKIKIETNMKSISNKFTIIYLLYTGLIPLVCNILLETLINKPKNIEQFINNTNNIGEILLLICIFEIIIFYVIQNTFLEKHISVSWKKNNNESNNIRNT